MEYSATYEVHVNVGSTLLNDAHGTLPEGTLAARNLAIGPDVTVLAGNLLSDRELSALGERAGTGGVENGAERTGTVGGDDVEGTRDAAASGGDLRQGVAGQSHGLGDIGSLDLATTSGLAHAVGHDVLALEDSGVELSLIWDKSVLWAPGSFGCDGFVNLPCGWGRGREQRHPE